MNNKKLINKINSKYVLHSIFNYIKDNRFNMKLFFYSKLFQQKINLNLFDYQLAFLNKNGMNYYNYFKYSKEENYSGKFKKDFLKQKLKEDLSKYDNNLSFAVIPKIINYLENTINLKRKEKIEFDVDKDDDEIYENKSDIGIAIDIYSPFFNLLSINNKIFNKFSIIIPTNNFNKYKLINDYISIFDKLDKAKSNYESITLYITDKDDLNDLKKLKIKFVQIKKMKINFEGNFMNYESLFNCFFSLDINNYLLYFSLINNYYSKINPKLFIKINNFNNLENLSLIGFNFEETFIIKLPNLKILTINKCESITMNENTCLNLKKLYIYDSNIYYFGNMNSKLNLANVEECELIDRKSEICHYSTLIDFQSFTNLKSLKVEDSDFSNLNNNIPLENITVYAHSFSKRSMNPKLDVSDILLVKKIISMKSLKKVNIKLNIINMEKIINIKEKNNSVTKLKIYLYDYYIGEFMIYFQKKFPNLLKLTLLTDSSCYNRDKENILEIIENKNYYINEIKLRVGNSNIKLLCGPYENLKKINIECLEKIKDIETILPIFSSKCNIIFKKLSFFRFKYIGQKEINSDILNNFYNNIDKMPNLKYFEFIYSVINGNENIFLKLKEKLRKLNLDYLNLRKI